MKFSIAGTGNAAHHVANMLIRDGHTLLQVYARQLSKAAEFTSTFGGQPIDNASFFSEKNEIIILAVSDDALPGISHQINKSFFVVHLSGTTPMTALVQDQRGVVWPVQSLSKRKTVDYSKVPFLIEASDERCKTFLHSVFGRISETVYFANSQQRSGAHLAAVFANNFVNQMIDIADKLLQENGLELDVLMPIIREEVEKVIVMNPREAQTGPAMRGDMETIQHHLNVLKNDSSALEIYRAVTNRILQQYHGKKL